MATARPFAYNPSLTPIEGTIQVGDLAVGFPTSGFTDSPQFWNGPDEELGYVIAIPVPDNTQPTPVKTNRLYLSPIYKATDISLSNDNQTATQVFSYQQSVLGETPIGPTDKVMFSVQFNSTNPSVGVGGHFIGIGLTSMNYSGPFNGYPGNAETSSGFSDDGKLYYNDGVSNSGLPTWTSGDIIDIVVDGTLGSWYIRVNGGYWNNSSSADPVTNNGGVSFYVSIYYYLFPVLCPYIYGSMIIQNYPIFDVPAGYLFLGDTLASVGFNRSELNDSSFINLTNSLFNQNFTGASEASIWLTTNGYWNSYPCLGIATNDSGGLTGWGLGALSVAYNPTLISTYPVGSTITFQDGSTATIVGYDPYAPNYIDIFWDIPKTGTLFPITICSYSENGGDGLTPETAGDNALQIKTDYPSSQDGLYWIKNNNISGGTPFQIYADMTTDGGGWTLLVTNQNTAGWSYSNSILLNEFNPVSGGSNYSIVAYGDYLKSSGTTFQYMIDAYQRNQFGGIWSAPSGYTFLNTDNTQTSITLDIKFGTWNYNDSGIEQYMPWRSNSSGLLTTSSNPGGEWWGTLVTSGGWSPAPWINGDCGLDGCMPNPGIIWYWVR